MGIKQDISAQKKLIENLPLSIERELWRLQSDINTKIWALASLKRYVNSIEPEIASTVDVYGVSNENL
jgi:hypothetical protein